MGKKAERAKSNGLLAANGGISDKFKAVLGEIFQRFDADRDNALSLKELEDFAVASRSGGDLVQDELRQLGKFFDTDAKGNITLKGFEQMYLMQTGQQAVSPATRNHWPHVAEVLQTAPQLCAGTCVQLTCATRRTHLGSTHGGEASSSP